MKPYLVSLFSVSFAFLSPALHAQVVVEPVPPAPAEVVVPVTPVPAPAQVVVEEVPPVVEVLDPVVVQRQLSIAPRVVVVPAPELKAVPVPPATAIEAFNNRPRRVYDYERNVVVVEEKEQKRELSYATLPVLFVKETAELLDEQSRADLENMAKVILGVIKTDPNARFEIEGHTSTDGTDEFNLNLSVARAQRVYEELTKRYGVPAEVLSGHGYGEKYPKYPQGTEAQMQHDRRVLVVRAS